MQFFSFFILSIFEILLYECHIKKFSSISKILRYYIVARNFLSKRMELLQNNGKTDILPQKNGKRTFCQKKRKKNEILELKKTEFVLSNEFWQLWCYCKTTFVQQNRQGEQPRSPKAKAKRNLLNDLIWRKKLKKYVYVAEIITKFN